MRTKQMPDPLDMRILQELQRDARASFNALARRLGTTTPTVSWRVRRLQEVGIIRGFTVETAESATRHANEAKDSVWPCANCADPILGQGLVRSLGKRFYAFCCDACQETFTRRHERKVLPGRVSPNLRGTGPRRSQVYGRKE